MYARLFATRTLCSARPYQRCTSLLSGSRCQIERPSVAPHHKTPQHHRAGGYRHWQQLHRTAAAAIAAETMDSAFTAVQPLIQRIHAAPPQAVIYTTGGGFQALTWLLTVPGASRTVLEARVPYATSALAALLEGQEPQTSASTETALAMADAAFKSATTLAPSGVPLIGLGCTCALVTDREKKGDHKVAVAARSASGSTAWAVTLEKGARTRAAEDALASRLLLALLAKSTGVQLQSDSTTDLLGNSETLQETSWEAAGEPLQALLAGAVRSVEFTGGQVVVDAPRRGRVYLPGSFNPLHDGHRRKRWHVHRQLLAAGVKAVNSGAEGCYELSVGNPDKGLLPLDEIKRRVQPFIDSETPLVVVQAPLFTDKARLYPNATFVVGHDTAVRLVDEKYYNGAGDMILQFAQLAASGCKFRVAGRVRDDGTFATLDDITISDTLQQLDLFTAIPEAMFRLDISSTELRRRAERDGKS